MCGDYRFVVADGQEADGLKVIDLGAGHSSSGGTLCGRVIAALKSEALLNESVGAGYIDRNWPPAFADSGAWPLASLRQSFLNGSLTRLIDPDAVLRGKIVEFVNQGDFGVGYGHKPEGGYERLWFQDLMAPEDVAFEAGVFLLKRAAAELLKAGVPVETRQEEESQPGLEPDVVLTPGSQPELEPVAAPGTRTIRLVGTIPPEVWNRLGTKLVPSSAPAATSGSAWTSASPCPRRGRVISLRRCGRLSTISGLRRWCTWSSDRLPTWPRRRTDRVASERSRVDAGACRHARRRDPLERLPDSVGTRRNSVEAGRDAVARGPDPPHPGTARVGSATARAPPPVGMSHRRTGFSSFRTERPQTAGGAGRAGRAIQ